MLAGNSADGSGLLFPRHHENQSDHHASKCAEQERLERFVRLKIREGQKVFGTYPPNDKTRAEYEDWVKAGEPEE